MIAENLPSCQWPSRHLRSKVVRKFTLAAPAANQQRDLSDWLWRRLIPEL